MSTPLSAACAGAAVTASNNATSSPRRDPAPARTWMLAPSGGGFAGGQRHDREVAVPVARRLVGGLLGDADELAARAAFGGDPAVRVADAGEAEDAAKEDEHDGDPDPEVEG